MNIHAQTTASRWHTLGSRIGLDANGSNWRDTFAALRDSYGDKARHHHTLKGHILPGLEELSRAVPIAQSIVKVESAFWFHDVIFDTSRTDSEERSGSFAQERLVSSGATLEFARSVNDMIVFTKHLLEPQDIDTRILLDIDLAQLAVPREQFVHNTQRIRKEYPQLTGVEFRKGRAEFFHAMLDKPLIYLTEPFRDAHEAAARANIEAALAELRRR